LFSGNRVHDYGACSAYYPSLLAAAPQLQLSHPQDMAGADCEKMAAHAFAERVCCRPFNIRCYEPVYQNLLER